MILDSISLEVSENGPAIDIVLVQEDDEAFSHKMYFETDLSIAECCEYLKDAVIQAIPYVGKALSICEIGEFGFIFGEPELGVLKFGFNEQMSFD